MKNNNKIIMLLLVVTILILGFVYQGKNEININDSYENQPVLKGEFLTSKKIISIELNNKLSFDCILLIDFKDKTNKLNNITVSNGNVSRRFGENTSINISSMRFPYSENVQSQRLNINLSSSNLLSDEVGSCLIDVIPNDSIIISFKTDNIEIKNTVQ